MLWKVRETLVSLASSSVGTQSCPTPPRHPAVRPDPTRLWFVQVLDSTSAKHVRETSCHFGDASAHFDHAGSVLELGAVQPLREELSLVVGSGCFVNPHVAVVVRFFAGGDFVQQADGNAVNTRQVSHGGGISIPDGADRRLVAVSEHRIVWFPDELLQKELCGQEL